MSIFSLLVNGQKYSGWETIRVTRGLERCSADFALSVSERWATASDAWHILPGMACEIHIDKDLVLTGWVDAFRPRYDATTHTVEVTGRSKTCDFIDSSVTDDSGQFTGLTLEELAKKLAAPFGLKVIAEYDSDPIPEVQCQQSETCFALLERLARMQEMLITDNPEGDLILTVAGADSATTMLVQGDNLVAADGDLDNSQRFSKYIVKVQRAGNKTNDDKMVKGRWDQVISRAELPLFEQWHLGSREWAARRRAMVRDDSGDSGDEPSDPDNPDDPATDTETDKGPGVITQIVGTAEDTEITRYRPLVIVGEAEGDDEISANRADWEMRRRKGNATKASCHVQGWHQRDGTLWATNLTVHMTSPWLAVDRDVIISEVEFTYGPEGEMTALHVTLPDAFLPKKIKHHKHRKAKKGKKKGGADAWSGVT